MAIDLSIKEMKSIGKKLQRIDFYLKRLFTLKLYVPTKDKAVNFIEVV